MRDIPTEAAFLREGLRLGALDVDEVVAWSDAIVAEQAEPGEVFLELSSMRKAHALDVLGRLESLSGQVSALTVLPSALGRAHARLVGNPGYARDLVWALDGICEENDYELPDELMELGHINDVFKLAWLGTLGSVEDAHEKLLEFTGRFGHA